MLIPCFASAEDWLVYLNQPYTVILEKFGTPEKITRPVTQTLSVYDGNRDGRSGYADENLSFCYYDIGVVFDFDDQGSLRPTKNAVAGEGDEYFKYFGTDGILRVCGITFIKRHDSGQDDLVYGVRMGDSIVSVKNNRKLGKPTESKPPFLYYSLDVTGENPADRGISSDKVKMYATDKIVIMFENDFVTYFKIYREHTFWITGK